MEAQTEQKPDLPKRKNLWEALMDIKKDGKEGWEKEWKNIFKKLQGERVYRRVKKVDGREVMQYLRLRVEPGQKINKSAELAFDVYENGKKLDTPIFEEIGKIKYREWKKTEKAPEADSDYLDKNGNIVKWADVPAGEKKSVEQLRVHEGVYKDKIKSRSEAAKEFMKEKAPAMPEAERGVLVKNGKAFLDRKSEDEKPKSFLTKPIPGISKLWPFKPGKKELEFTGSVMQVAEIVTGEFWSSWWNGDKDTSPLKEQQPFRSLRWTGRGIKKYIIDPMPSLKGSKAKAEEGGSDEPVPPASVA